MILKMKISNWLYWNVSSRLMIIPSDECNGIVLMISHICFRQWHGAVWLQANTSTNIDRVLWLHTASVGHTIKYFVYTISYNMALILINIYQCLFENILSHMKLISGNHTTTVQDITMSKLCTCWEKYVLMPFVACCLRSWIMQGEEKKVLLERLPQ